MLDGTPDLLAGWRVTCAEDADAPIASAAAVLARFGAEQVSGSPGAGFLEVQSSGGPQISVGLHGWSGEGVLGTALERFGWNRSSAPNGNVLETYAALRLAGVAVTAARLDLQPVLSAGRLVDELLAGLAAASPSSPELVRCRDGWAVARWRDEDERQLFRALVGSEGETGIDEAVSRARSARLLVGAVRPPRRGTPLEARVSRLDGRQRPQRHPRVLDWSVLWAGPWATQQLRTSGAIVQRIEHPRRRDGLLGWPGGRSWWRQLNRGKRLALLDARDVRHRGRLEAAVREADVLVTSMTPRAAASLGFDNERLAELAPGMLHIELVAFAGPWADAPGLGEQAAAEAGLFWREDGAPASPYPWADPLLAATTLAVCRTWLAADRPRGGRIRLTLEGAAGLPFVF